MGASAGGGKAATTVGRPKGFAGGRPGGTFRFGNGTPTNAGFRPGALKIGRGPKTTAVRFGRGKK